MSLAALTDYYNKDLWPLRDRRLDGWLMMDSIAPTLVASSAYVACATVVGPWFMRDRRPYDLKAVMQVYNLFQVRVVVVVVAAVTTLDVLVVFAAVIVAIVIFAAVFLRLLLLFLLLLLLLLL